MKNLMLFKVRGQKHNFTGAIVESETDPYPYFKVSVHKNGRRYLREPNHFERKRIYKYTQEHEIEIFKFEKAFRLGVGK